MERRCALLATASTQVVEFDIDNYLTIVALEDGLTAALSGNTIEYCVDGDGKWKSLVSNTNSVSINKGHMLSFRGNLTPASKKGVGRFTISKSCDLTGNCNSLLFGDDAADNLDLTGKDYAFYQLFYNCRTIKNVSSNFLPATTLANNCYDSMFWYCSSLTTAPQLPATTLKNMCYYYMFASCSSLTIAPELPATTLANLCYEYMFQYCSSLTTAPELPATTLANFCYSNMFSYCRTLTTAPQLPATTLAYHCYNNLFCGCTSLTIAPALPATTLKGSCYYYMFYGCTSLTTAPQLPATKLAEYCYKYMFQNCTSLTTAPALPAKTLVSECYDYMFNGCSKLNYIKAMFTTTPSSSYTNNWVSGVASSGTFVKNKNATWNVTGTYGIPSGWTVQTA